MSNLVIIEANKEHKKTMKALKGLWLFVKNVIPAVLIIAALN